jgi:LPS sulfotransferase NodH
LNVRPFLVLKLPRTGSSMFGKVLDAHPSVICRNEYLNRLSEATRAEKVEAIRAFYRHPDRLEGAVPDAAVGQTMNPYKYGLRPLDVASAFGPEWLGGSGRRLLAGRRKLPIRVILLLRGNLLKQAVSQQWALRYRHASSRHMVDPAIVKRQEYDVPELVELVGNLRDRSERLRRFADELGAQVMSVTYEQLQTDRISTFDSVFAYLGVPPPAPGFDYSAGYTKLLAEDLRDVVANFAEIEREPVLAGYL